MAYETSGDTDADELPVDPDLDLVEDVRHRPSARRRRPTRKRRGGSGFRSRLRPGVLVAIAAGGALGGGARYLIELAAPVGGEAFPWATFSINVAGSFAVALLLVFILDIWPPTRYVRPFAAIGFLGAFTTFSTWMVESVELVGHSRTGLAAVYLAASLLAGLAAVSLGLVLGRSFLARRARASSKRG